MWEQKDFILFISEAGLPLKWPFRRLSLWCHTEAWCMFSTDATWTWTWSVDVERGRLRNGTFAMRSWTPSFTDCSVWGSLEISTSWFGFLSKRDRNDSDCGRLLTGSGSHTFSSAEGTLTSALFVTLFRSLRLFVPWWHHIVASALNINQPDAGFPRASRRRTRCSFLWEDDGKLHRRRSPRRNGTSEVKIFQLFLLATVVMINRDKDRQRLVLSFQLYEKLNQTESEISAQSLHPCSVFSYWMEFSQKFTLL